VAIIVDRLRESSAQVLIRQGGRQYGYDAAVEGIEGWLARFPSLGIVPGEVVSLVGRFSFDATVLLLALLENRNIVVPLNDESRDEVDKRNRVACSAHCVKCHDRRDFAHEILRPPGSHPLLDALRGRRETGVILFTSGSTGESKAAVHAFSRFVAKYTSAEKKKPFNVMVFLKFDHIGGLNTMFAVVMNGGCMTVAEDRSPNGICKLIQDEKVEILPTTPSFLNMLVLSKAWERYDISSLKTITYGTEPIPGSTLKALAQIFPGVKLKQTYGLTELGIFSTRSRANESTFMAIREGDVRTKVVDGLLYIKTDSAMLGYLNAESPFDSEGWYNTGDRVVVEGGYTKILGRESDIINVGGEKVYPTEVESVLLEMDNVLDVAVEAKISPVVGQIVAAVFQLEQDEDLPSLRRRVAEHCRGRLESYKVPRHVVISDQGLMSARLKKTRRNLKPTRGAQHGR